MYVCIYIYIYIYTQRAGPGVPTALAEDFLQRGTPYKAALSTVSSLSTLSTPSLSALSTIHSIYPNIWGTFPSPGSGCLPIFLRRFSSRYGRSRKLNQTNRPRPWRVHYDYYYYYYYYDFNNSYSYTYYYYDYYFYNLFVIGHFQVETSPDSGI